MLRHAVSSKVQGTVKVRQFKYVRHLNSTPNPFLQPRPPRNHQSPSTQPEPAARASESGTWAARCTASTPCPRPGPTPGSWILRGPKTAPEYGMRLDATGFQRGNGTIVKFRQNAANSGKFRQHFVNCTWLTVAEGQEGTRHGRTASVKNGQIT